MPETAAIHPGDRIRMELKERGWTQADLARILDRPIPTISQIISGKTSITPETALQLSVAFDTSPETWLLLESNYRLAEALKVFEEERIAHRARLFQIAPVKEMQRRGWLSEVDDLDWLEKDLQKFFRVRDLAATPPLETATRRSNDCPMNSAQRAWCYRAMNLGLMTKVKRYRESALDECISRIRTLAAWPEELRRIPEVLAEAGIRFVVVEPLQKTRIDGAVVWANKSTPILAVSIRYDRIDSFMHTLAHELSHIRHRDGLDSLHVDTDLVGGNRPSPAELSSVELRADREASATWIKTEILDDFCSRVGPLYSKARINQFANSIRIHPGIIVGQLQYRGEISFSSHRQPLVKIRDIVTATAMTDGWGHTVEV